jgi:hypothetical protein
MLVYPEFIAIIIYAVFIVQAYQTPTELLSTSRQVAQRFRSKLPTVK